MAQTFALPEHVAWVLDGQQALVRDLHTGHTVVLSPEATEIWCLAVESVAVPQIVEELARLHPEVGAEILAGHVAVLVTDLVTRGLLSESA